MARWICLARRSLRRDEPRLEDRPGLAVNHQIGIMGSDETDDELVDEEES